MATEIIFEYFGAKFQFDKLYHSSNCFDKGIDLNVYSMERKCCETFKTQSDWPPVSNMGVAETTKPDVLTSIRETINGRLRKRIVIIGDVKSSVEIGSGAKQADMFQEAWRQALLGLVDSDHAYGILFQPQQCELFELKTERLERRKGGSKLLATTVLESFEFVNKLEYPNFISDSIILLLKKIIAIILELDTVTDRQLSH